MRSMVKFHFELIFLEKSRFAKKRKSLSKPSLNESLGNLQKFAQIMQVLHQFEPLITQF